MKEFLMENGAFLFWGFVAIASLVIEALTAELVSCWFAPSAIVSMILSSFMDIFWVQLLVFMVLSILLLAFARRIVKKHLDSKKKSNLNADSLIGRTGIVQEPINNLLETGSVKIAGLVWTARSVRDEEIKPDTIVVVREISGVKLICEPSTKESNL